MEHSEHFNAKALHEFVELNCLYCQHHDDCENLAEMKERVRGGKEPKPNGRCERFEDIAGLNVPEGPNDSEELPF